MTVMPPMCMAPSVPAGGEAIEASFLPGYPRCHHPRELMVALDLVKKQRESPDWSGRFQGAGFMGIQKGFRRKMATSGGKSLWLHLCTQFLRDIF